MTLRLAYPGLFPSRRLSFFGLYRFDVIHLPGESPGKKLCGLAVHKGAAAVQLPSMISLVTPDRFVSLNLECGDRMVLQTFDTARSDSLHEWSHQRMRLPERTP